MKRRDDDDGAFPEALFAESRHCVFLRKYLLNNWVKETSRKYIYNIIIIIIGRHDSAPQ